MELVVDTPSVVLAVCQDYNIVFGVEVNVVTMKTMLPNEVMLAVYDNNCYKLSLFVYMLILLLVADVVGPSIPFVFEGN